MATPSWLAATTGQPAQAGQINQFLGTHAASYIYQGVNFSTQPTPGSGSVSTNGLWIAQEILTTTNTTLGRVVFTLSITGSPGPMTVLLHGNNSGVPDSTTYVTTVVPPGDVTTGFTSVSIPLPTSALTASSHYWVIFEAVGDASDYYSLGKNNQTSGAATSTNGTSWTAQSYGFLYSAYDQTPTPPLAHTWEDSGARWTTLVSNGSGQYTGLREYTTAQGSGQYMYSSRTLGYSGNSLISVT